MRDRRQERQALHHQHQREDVDLVDLLVVGRSTTIAAPISSSAASTASQNAGKSGPCGSRRPWRCARRAGCSFHTPIADRARDRPLHRHGGEHRADHLAERDRDAQPIERDEMRERRPRRPRGSGWSGSCPGWRCRRRRPPAPRSRLRIATTTPIALGAEPVEPAEREFALLLAREAARAGQQTPPVLAAGSGSRHRPSGGAASCRPRTCRAAGRGRSGGWCSATCQPCSSTVRPRSVSSTDGVARPAAGGVERGAADQAHGAVHDDGVGLVALDHADVEEAGIFAVHGVVHDAALAVAMVLRRLDHADLRIGEGRHQVLEPVGLHHVVGVDDADDLGVGARYAPSASRSAPAL